MRRTLVLVLALAFILTSGQAFTQQKASTPAQEHEKHHPAQQAQPETQQLKMGPGMMGQGMMGQGKMPELMKQMHQTMEQMQQLMGQKKMTPAATKKMEKMVKQMQDMMKQMQDMMQKCHNMMQQMGAMMGTSPQPQPEKTEPQKK